MKGDFTRFTFQPQKHYSSVLMQQGRLQLDADWNEQMSILNHLNQIQTKDLIGSGAGTPSIAGGYQILPPVNLAIATTEATTEKLTDLRITEGRFYIDGILCELNPGKQISVSGWISPTQLQVSVLMLDAQALEKDQWIELEIPTEQKVQIQQCQISKVEPEKFMLTLAASVSQPVAGEQIKLRRLTTYKTQATYPNPEALAPDAGIYLAYLDVWQRHVTALDDRALKEVALNGLDTTTRLQTIAQVKLLNITADLNQLTTTTETTPITNLANSYDRNNKIFRSQPDSADLVALPAWQALTTRSVLMNATTASEPKSSDPLGNYQGGDNRLYRVEIHRDDRAADSDVIFKWSRDNGSIVSAIDRIEGDIVFLKGSIQEEYNLFQGNPWVEIITEAQELNNQPGILVQLRDVKPPNLLLLDLSQVQGGSQPKATAAAAEQEKFKVRRWDGQMNPKTDWQLLEQGIQVQFPDFDPALPRNGDFWLLPARAGQPLAWVRDLPPLKSPLGQPIPQRPLGIEHHYGILAIVRTENGEFTSAVAEDEDWEKVDLRTQFLPLAELVNKLGITAQPEAQLYVKGTRQSAKGKIRKLDDQSIEISGTEARLAKGCVLSIGAETALIETATRTGDVLRLTLKTPAFSDLSTEFQDKDFSYQQPLVRFETENASAPQFFLDPFGKIGINTFEPTAQLDIQGNSTAAIDCFQVKSETATLFKVQPNGKVGIGINNPEGVLDVRTLGGTSFKVQPDDKVVVDINQPGGSFDVRAAGSTLFKVQQSDSKVGIGIDPPQARLDVRNTLRVTAPRIPPATSAFFQIESQANQPVAFTSHSSNAQGYSFDQKVTVRKGGITVEDGGATITGNVTIATDQIVVNNTGTSITKGVTLPTGDLKIDNGSLTIGNDPDDAQNSVLTQNSLNVENLTVRESLTLAGTTALTFNRPTTFGENGNLTTNSSVTVNLPGNKKITLDSRETDFAVIDLPKEKLAIQKGTTPLVTLSPSVGSPANPKLYVAGNVVIGKDYKENEIGLPNSLIVQDRVQIATKDSTPNLSGMPDTATDQSKLKLYADGNAYINGQLFAQKVSGTTIEQVSSSTLKENITTLSTLEAQQMLEQLNPVKFNYTLPIDTTPRVGFIAEEVPDLLTSPDQQSVCLLDVIAVLTKTVKDLHHTIQDQQEAIATLARRVQNLSGDDWRCMNEE